MDDEKHIINGEGDDNQVLASFQNKLSVFDNTRPTASNC